MAKTVDLITGHHCTQQYIYSVEEILFPWAASWGRPCSAHQRTPSAPRGAARPSRPPRAAEAAAAGAGPVPETAAIPGTSPSGHSWSHLATASLQSWRRVPGALLGRTDRVDRRRPREFSWPASENHEIMIQVQCEYSRNKILCACFSFVTSPTWRVTCTRYKFQGYWNYKVITYEVNLYIKSLHHSPNMSLNRIHFGQRFI